jgi:hypothetical protein
MRTLIQIAAGVALSALLGFVVLAQPTVVALDYRAFYCAGMAVRQHANPYHTASLRDCELTKTDAQYRSRLPHTTLPAPQPLYDIAFFALLSGLPFTLAKAIWGAIIGAAIFTTVFSLVRLTGLSPPTVLAIASIALIGDALALGQIIPIYTAAASSAALLAKEGRAVWAGVAAVCSLIEPHLGLPICAALAIWSPRSRPALAAGCGILAASALAVGGVQTNLEYVTNVLPLHALSELSSDRQLSLSVILQGLHVPSSIAVAAGSLSYVFMTAVGVVLGRALSLRRQNDAFLVTAPAATAVVGGAFLHGTDIIAAIPLALMLAAIPCSRRVSAAAIVLLATPWIAESGPHDMVGWFALAAVLAAYMLWSIGNVRPLLSAACAAIIFAVLCQVNFAYERDQNVYEQHVQNVPAPRIDERYPEASWGRVMAGTFATQSAPAWIARVPTWGGLILLLAITLKAAFAAAESKGSIPERRLTVNVN